MTDGEAVRTRPEGLLRLVVAAIGLHSAVLGLLFLVAPLTMTRALGFADVARFFPSQSGAFLFALGVCYLLALRERALVAVIAVSKIVAVPFLVVHAAFLDAPPLVWAAAAGDATMLVVLLLVVRRERISAARE